MQSNHAIVASRCPALPRGRQAVLLGTGRFSLPSTQPRQAGPALQVSRRVRVDRSICSARGLYALLCSAPLRSALSDARERWRSAGPADFSMGYKAKERYMQGDAGLKSASKGRHAAWDTIFACNAGRRWAEAHIQRDRLYLLGAARCRALPESRARPLNPASAFRPGVHPCTPRRCTSCMRCRVHGVAARCHTGT